MSLGRVQWRRNRGFRRFNEPAPRAPGAPSSRAAENFLGKNLRKNIKIVTIRWRILRLKCTKFDFGWGSAPDPAGGAYSAPQTPSWIWGPLRGRGRGWAGEEEGKGAGKGRERSGGERKGGPPSYCWTRAPQSLATPLVAFIQLNVKLSQIDRDLLTSASDVHHEYRNEYKVKWNTWNVENSLRTFRRTIVHANLKLFTQY